MVSLNIVATACRCAAILSTVRGARLMASFALESMNITRMNIVRIWSSIRCLIRHVVLAVVTLVGRAAAIRLTVRPIGLHESLIETLNLFDQLLQLQFGVS